MKLKWLAVLGVGLLAVQVGCGEKQDLKTEKDKRSYGVGVDMARNFKRQGIDVELDLVVKGLKDVYAGQPLLMGEKDLRKTMGEYQAELRRKQAQARRVAVVENKKEGDAFLAENKNKEGVVVLPNGLQYKIIKAGEGKKPTEADTVECHYRGTLINGTEFDGTYGAGEPATFKLTGVVPGWREALKLMPVGSKWQIVIPPELAYGERGAGVTIGPNATLIFEVELLAIK